MPAWKVRTAFGAEVQARPGEEGFDEGRHDCCNGGGEDETGWPRQGRMSFILDNLIAAKKARPMIVVMEQGYARRPGEPAAPTAPPWPTLNPPTGSREVLPVPKPVQDRK